MACFLAHMLDSWRMRSRILTILLCSGFLMAQSANDDKIYDAGKDGVTRPVPVNTPAPPMPNSLKYADQKRGEHLHQQVVVKGVVTKDGHFRDLSIQESAGKDREDADSAALRTLKGWKFKPCKLEGKPVNCRMVVEVAFNMY
jgi:TonB family protein